MNSLIAQKGLLVLTKLRRCDFVQLSRSVLEGSWRGRTRRFFVSPDLNCKTDQCRITSNTGHHYVIWSRKC